MFIDAYHDKKKEIIHVVERVDGKRILKEYPAKYVLYYPDGKGKFTDISGNRVARAGTPEPMYSNSLFGRQ